jgi:hypothetical protein
MFPDNPFRRSHALLWLQMSLHRLFARRCAGTQMSLKLRIFSTGYIYEFLRNVWLLLSETPLKLKCVWINHTSRPRAFISNSMEQNPPWKQRIPQLVEKFPAFHGSWTIHYRVHKVPFLFSIPRQINAVHEFSSCSFEVHFNIITHSASISSKGTPSFKWSPQNIGSTAFPLPTCRTLRPSHPP